MDTFENWFVILLNDDGKIKHGNPDDTILSFETLEDAQLRQHEEQDAGEIAIILPAWMWEDIVFVDLLDDGETVVAIDGEEHEARIVEPVPNTTETMTSALSYIHTVASIRAGIEITHKFAYQQADSLLETMQNIAAVAGKALGK